MNDDNAAAAAVGGGGRSGWAATAAADGDNGGPGVKQLFRSQADRDRRQKRERSTTPSHATAT